VRRLVTSLTVFAVLVGICVPAAANWVWRNGRWVYVDTTEPVLPSPAEPPKEVEKPRAPIRPAPPPPEEPAEKPAPAPKTEAPTATKAETPAAPSPNAPAPPAVEHAARSDPAEAGTAADAQKTLASQPWWKRGWWSFGEKTPFEQAQADFAAGNYRLAAMKFKDAIKESPTAPHREEAMWMRASALFALKEYYQAYEQYEELITQYAGSPHYREALLKEIEIAELFLKGERRKVWGMSLMVRSDTEALEILRKVYEHQPAGALAASVVLRIADYHWAKSEWPEAEDYYDKYCREYPNGQAAREAEFKRAKCAIERCRGARYDTTCLQLAYDRLRQFQAKFPDVAEREGVPAVLEEVRNRQAQALYEIAARYHRAGQVLAAAFYAERLRERFPDSPWNAIAMKFMAENAVREEPGK